MTTRATGRHQLRAWLNRSRQKQKDLAVQLGITDAYLSQILSGQRRAKLETLLRIEAVTGGAGGVLGGYAACHIG